MQKRTNKIIITLGIVAGTVTMCFSGYALMASKTELQFVEKKVERTEKELDLLRIEIREELRIIRTDVKSLLRSVSKSCCAIK